MNTNSNLDKQLAIRFKPSDFDQLKQISGEKGLSVSSLVRMWLFERMKAEKQSR